jgi:hypothetical protein
MRASRATLEHTAVRLSDLAFPATQVLLHRTRLAYVHLDNLISFAKRDRDGRVDAFLAGYLTDELVLLFFKRGDIVNAATMTSDARVVLSTPEAIDRMQAELERGEVIYAAAPFEQISLMYASCAGPAVPRPIDPADPHAFFNDLHAEQFTGRIELMSAGRTNYLLFEDGRFTRGFFHHKAATQPISQYVESLFARLPDGSAPAIAASIIPDLGEVPEQAPVAQVQLYREVFDRITTAVETEVPREGKRKSARAHAALLQRHPVLNVLAPPDGGEPGTVSVTIAALTAALADWTILLLQDVEVVSPGSAPRLLKESTRERRFVLQAAGFYERLPWHLTW